jgi:hypothetical protein
MSGKQIDTTAMTATIRWKTGPHDSYKNKLRRQRKFAEGEIQMFRTPAATRSENRNCVPKRWSLHRQRG